jgi:hypothetical protein
MSETPILTFESVARLHLAAPAERQDAGLRAWRAALTGEPSQVEVPTYALNELPPFFGLRHYTTLSRLKVQKVGISFGGRLRYRLADVRRWLESAECMAVREELRGKRRAQGGRSELVTSEGEKK